MYLLVVVSVQMSQKSSVQGMANVKTRVPPYLLPSHTSCFLFESLLLFRHEVPAKKSDVFMV